MNASRGPERSVVVTSRSRPARRPAPRLGYQPGLDGLRALSVIAVIWYHAGFSWMPGGFIGVEVFFVVSGFLITSLLLDERARDGAVSMATFWLRRARRLLPALLTMLLVVLVWAALVGTAAQVDELRRDLPWALAYVANWGQILGEVPYFASADPPLLRHLWSLAVEEQWYLIWPVAFVALTRTAWTHARIAAVLAAAAGVVILLTAWWSWSDQPQVHGPFGLLDGADRINVLYLSTVTRSSGLLLGAAAAFVWRPWRSRTAAGVPARRLDVAAGAALGVLACVAIAAHVTDPALYRWILPMASVASVVAVAVTVHPAAVGTRAVLSHPALVAVGRRSYGLYLWHWPVFVVLGATSGSVWRFAAASVVAVAAAEACFRLVETPIRVHGVRGRWAKLAPVRWAPLGAAGVAAVAVVAGLAVWTAEPYDPALGGDEVRFEFAADVDPAVGTGVDDAPVAGSSDTAVTTAAPSPVRLTILGDSQAHSLAINLPTGIEETFEVTNGAIPGCGVLDRGRVLSERESFSNDFAVCRGWQDEWATAARGAEVALVFIGAWDVFDVEVDGVVIGFDTAEGDALFTASLRSGIDAVLAEGVEVGLLEVPCMRPVPAEGAAVPPLPERGDDARVAHLNDLLRRVAAGYDADVSVVDGPDEWCTDESIATDLGYRWDGVHVFRPGANLIYRAVAPTLLSLVG